MLYSPINTHNNTTQEKANGGRRWNGKEGKDLGKYKSILKASFITAARNMLWSGSTVTKGAQ